MLVLGLHLNEIRVFSLSGFFFFFLNEICVCGVTHVAMCRGALFFLPAVECSFYGDSTSGSPVDGHLSCSQFSPMTGKAAVNSF